VALGELGDKTQLVVLLLALQLKSPWRVLAGVSLGAASVHILSVLFGSFIQDWAGGRVFNSFLGLGFLAFSAFLFWSARRSSSVNFQEVCQNIKTPFRSWQKYPLLTSALVFFTAELGDKTQLATIALAAHFELLLAVWLGAILGLFILNALVIFSGEKILGKLPLSFVKTLSASLFLILGFWILFTRS
jgi:putative Ca2+/H+ antiporter (TMEM165/GDT1 family)